MKRKQDIMGFEYDISILWIVEKEKTETYNIFRTFQSILKSMNYAKNFNISGEIVIVIDKTDIYSKNYVHKLSKEYSGDSLSIVEIDNFDNINNVLSRISSKYIATVVTGSLFSQNWIYKAFKLLKNSTGNIIVHPEFQLKYNEISNSLYRQLTDSDNTFEFNNFAYYNLSKLVCMALKGTIIDFLQKNENKILHKTAPESIYFSKNLKNDESTKLKCPMVYEKSDKKRFSELLESKRVFLYGAGAATESQLKQLDLSHLNIQGIIDRDKNKSGKFIEGYKVFALDEIEKLDPDVIILTVEKWTLVYLTLANNLMEKNIKAIILPDILRELSQNTSINSISDEILEQWKLMFSVDPANSLRNFSVASKIINIQPDIYDDNYRLLDQLCSEESVDYLFFIPWMTIGGADLEVLNYINAVNRINSDKNIVVFSTQNKESLWKHRIPEGVKFIEIDKVFKHLSHDERKELLANFILNRKPAVIHNINSAICYSIFVEYGEQICKKSNLFITVFCPEYTESNELLGYPFSSLPYCFKFLTRIFADNQAFVNMLCSMYDYDREKFQVHYHPIEILERKTYINKIPVKKSMDILWAGRLDKQKRPDILAQIAKKCLNKPYKFHVYGGALLNDDIYTRELEKLENVICYGKYDNFYSLDKSNIDIFLNNSQWEGLPNILLEVMSSGIPVVTSDAGGIAELVNKQNGFLVSPYDDVDQYISILDKIFENSSVSENIVENAYDTLCSQHSWDSFIKTLKKDKLYIC